MIKRMLCLLSALLLALPLSAGAEGTWRFDADQLADFAAYFDGVKLTRGLKSYGQDTPVMTQRFGADPWALVYDGRVYLYMTGDVLETDDHGAVTQNTYARINTLNVVSSADLVNWTDHGWVVAAGRDGASKWGSNSWAPAVACKEIDGQMRFFIYFANGGNGIGVLTSDSPTGPFTDPLGRALISRSTPNCSNVTWLFDPAVLVDEDGSAYLYFGGGIPRGREADPGTGRVVRLGSDMISIEGTPQALSVPFLFEDSGINRVGDTYIYSYCTNWNVTAGGKAQYGIENAQIAYMTSDSPMGPFAFAGVVLKNPGNYFGVYGNNHHSMFRFADSWYIAWHSQLLEKPLGISGGYRSTGITRIDVSEGGDIALVASTDRASLDQVGSLDPYAWVEAETIGAMAGIDTVQADPDLTCGNMVVTGIDSGDWLCVYGADFGAGASSLTLRARAHKGAEGLVQVRLDGPQGPVIGYVRISSTQGEWQELTAELTGPAEGKHDVMFIFGGACFDLDAWRFQ